MTLVNDPVVWFKNMFIQAGLSYNISSLMSAKAISIPRGDVDSFLLKTKKLFPMRNDLNTILKMN